MKKILTILLTVMLVLPMTLAITGFAIHTEAAPRIYLDPSVNTFYTNETSVGYKFNVTAWVQDAPDIGAWQVYMEFNDSIINATRWFEPTGDAQYIFNGSTTSAQPSPPNPGYVHLSANKGRIEVASLLFPTPPAQPPRNGTGKLGIFEFVITAAPPENSTFTCALHINHADTNLLDPDGTEVPGVTKEDGSYSYIAPPPIPQPPHIWLETSPATVDLTVAKPFNVTVNVKNVSSTDYLVGIQFELGYLSPYLEILDTYEGDFLKTWAPYGTFFTAQDQGTEHNKTAIGQMILPNDTGYWDMTTWPSGEGAVAIITFLPILDNGTSATSFDLTLASLFGDCFIDKNGESILFLTPIGTSYTYNPAKPVLGVDPSDYIASHIAETFQINVTLTDLLAGWKLSYVEFELDYNSSFLNLLDVGEGPFMQGFGTTTFMSETGDGWLKANITLVPTGPFPSGSGTLVMLTFNATSRPPAESPLTLSNTKLEDPDGYKVYENLSQGHYVMYEVLVHHIMVDSTTYDVITVSNVAVDPVPMEFIPSHAMLSFNVSGWGTPAFVNVTVPNDLIWADQTANWDVIVDSTMMKPIVTIPDASHTRLTIDFNFASEPVFLMGTSAIPEMSTNISLLVLLLATLISMSSASIAYAKRKKFALFK